ncbi:MAG: hypothetical protein FWF06_01520 [Symbiobacteriaceae bacterium]|nr:hypothetical protein [Symbiobacteriaceae bacterium]
MSKLLATWSRSLTLLLIGAITFATVAMADLASGLAYHDFKKALKETAYYYSNRLMPNYTATSLMTLSVGGQEVVREEVTERWDLLAGRYQLEQVSLGGRSYTHLEDVAQGRIYTQGQYDDYWTVFEDASPYFRALASEAVLTAASNTPAAVGVIGSSDGPTRVFIGEYPVLFPGQLAPRSSSAGHLVEFDLYSNPRAEDLERIVDALVGNLAALVHSEITVEGGKRFSGVVTSAQLPPIVQALWPLVGQRVLFQAELRELALEQLSGSAVQSPEGHLTSCFLQLLGSGVDGNGQRQSLELLMGFAFEEVGSTSIMLPYLDDRTVYHSSSQVFSGQDDYRPMLQAKDLGLYRSAILGVDAQSWFKLADCYLELWLEDDTIFGHYREVYLQGHNSPVEVWFKVPNNAYLADTSIIEVVGVSDPENIYISFYHGGTPNQLNMQLLNFREIARERHTTPWARVWD